MSVAPRMHEDELEVDIPLVRRLLDEQFPAWAGLPLEPVLPQGTDNAIFRLGDGLSVRLPRIAWAVGQPDRDHRWLPMLAGRLPLEVPRPVVLGDPDECYPWRWAVHTWLDGEPAAGGQLRDPYEAAVDLARLVASLWRIDTHGAPAAGRGEPLATRDRQTRIWIAQLGGSVDTGAATALWEEALAAPAWDGAPVWVHADLDGRNLLARNGRLTGVLDFGGLGVGDPACDVGVAWKLLPKDAREVFRRELGADAATWARARGHVLSQSLGALAYYTPENNAVLVSEARRWLSDVLAER